MLPALLLPAVFACASAGLDLPRGCLYDGRWHTEGSSVATREACLRCSCSSGALWCRRRACAPLPEPPPPRCHVLHRRGACCPELHCPNGVTIMEHGAAARFQDEDFTDVATSSTVAHACVEGGTVYAAGSAMASGIACEQCFCLGGARRCVRPRCLPPPPGCVARPASGACCPQRYYCTHESTKPPEHNHDCEVDGRWVQEGDSTAPHSEGNCTACFCLHGSVRCQPLSCAPPLMGCEPLLRPGECCAHQYKCNHNQQGHLSRLQGISSNALSPTRNDDRAFHSSHLTRLESTTKNIQTSVYTMKHTPIAAATKNHFISTTKVKRKTDDTPLPSSSDFSIENVTSKGKTSSAKLIATTEESATESTADRVTDQPDATVKIIVNGTINCTAELSSTSLPLNISVNDTERVKMESLPRIPIMNTNIEAQTYSPNDIITDRNVNENFDENETFTINVTSSLRTNTSHSTTRPVASTSKSPAKTELADAFNTSKKTKEDYDYDYTEPTLPPSLPNLKIIPFVAADAVVEDNTAKDALNYPVLDRQDKFPVYYPSANNKDTAYATRREDVYNPTQYPVFISDKESLYPASGHSIDLTSNKYHNDLEYTVSSSLGTHGNDAKTITKIPATSSTFEHKTPAVNLFSPPVETEGGFIPKGPGIIDEYFAVYPSTPSGPAIPHLTTSMQLDTKGECTSADGQHVSEGDMISLACSDCHCSWGELQCAPKPCHTPPHCTRRPAATSAIDLCCGELVCEVSEKPPSSTEAPTTTNKQINDIPFETVVEHVTYQKNLTNQTLKNVTKDTKYTTVNISSGNTTTNHTQETNQTTPSTEKIENVTVRIISSTEKHTTTIIPTFDEEVNDTVSQEYEDDEDDEGFSLGSVLKLLLSDTYESTSTTAAPPTKPTTKMPMKTINIPTAVPTSNPSTIAPFIPMPPRPYIPTKIQQNTVNRIDHLVLGEATAIKKTTPRPVTVKTTPKPPPKTTRPVVEEALSVTQGPRPPHLGLPAGGVGPGLLKLAGCNIYGRMYRVGRIIAELSTPCQECWCTEFGVQCKQLGC